MSEFREFKVRGDFNANSFDRLNYQLVSDGTLVTDDHNTIMNVLRLRLRNIKSDRGFVYAFPITFGI